MEKNKALVKQQKLSHSGSLTIDQHSKTKPGVSSQVSIQPKPSRLLQPNISSGAQLKPKTKNASVASVISQSKAKPPQSIVKPPAQNQKPNTPTNTASSNAPIVDDDDVICID